MASFQTASLIGLLVALLQVCSSIPAPHPIVSRDLDKLQDLSLKEKLQRIHSLLTQLEADDDEGDLRTVAKANNPRKSKVEAQEKDMRSLGLEDREKFKAAVERLRAPPPRKIPEPPKPNPGTDDSIQTLAHALAKLHQTQGEEPDSDGERMGTKFNQKLKENKATEQAYQDEANKQLEETIGHALARLLEEDSYDQPNTNQVRIKQPPPPNHIQEEAIRIVEARLLQDVALANRLGISVDDLIQDFDERAAREETLREFENSLASLASGRDE